jgi:uncharacterized protein (TIGR02118 family)
MVRLFALLVPRRDMTPVAFHEHWRYVHGPLAGRIRRAVAYTQSHCLPDQPVDLPIMPYGGAAEVWFESLESANGLMSDPDYTDGAAHDEDNFHYMDQVVALQATQHVVTDGPPILKDTGVVKVMQFVRRADGVAPESFREQWLAGADEDAAGEELRLVRHVRCAAVPESYADGDPQFDGVRELFWPDEWSFMAARARAPEAWERLVRGPAIAPGSGFLVTSEHRVVWPGS